MSALYIFGGFVLGHDGDDRVAVSDKIIPPIAVGIGEVESMRSLNVSHVGEELLLGRLLLFVDGDGHDIGG